MDSLELLVEFHQNAKRQGPGSAVETQKALAFIPFANDKNIKILDIGCGSGTQTITLAENTRAHITAVDLFSPFLQKLEEKVERLNLKDRITTEVHSMDQLPYEEEQFDVIWSEGAIYIMGFEEGVRAWKKMLKKGGYLAVSELSWFTDSRPKALEEYWHKAYPQIDTVSNKIKILEENGYTPVAFFQLPDYCWLDEYYRPMQQRMPAFLAAHQHREEVIAMIEGELEEIEFYEKYSKYYGYGFYVARKV